jgi:hypothetical protein
MSISDKIPSPLLNNPPAEIENQTRSPLYLLSSLTDSSIDEITFILLADSFGPKYAKAFADKHRWEIREEIRGFDSHK